MKRLLSVFPVALLILVTLISMFSGCGAKSTKYIIATDATWPPFEYVDDNNKIVGFDIDLMDAIAKAADIEIQYENVGFDPLLAGMAQGTYDAAISSITILPDRAENMLFSDPYYVAGQMIIVKKDNTSITNQDSLKGKKLGAQLGTTGEALANETEGATVKSYNQIGLAVQDLLNGQIDAVICDTPIAEGYINKNASTLKIVGDSLTNESYGIAVSKGNEELLAKINTGLAAVKADGTLDALIQKWMAN